MKTEVLGQTYYSVQEFAERSERTTSHIYSLIAPNKDCEAGRKQEQIKKFVIHEEGKPFIHEDALKLFD